MTTIISISTIINRLSKMYRPWTQISSINVINWKKKSNWKIISILKLKIKKAFPKMKLKIKKVSRINKIIV